MPVSGQSRSLVPPVAQCRVSGTADSGEAQPDRPPPVSSGLLGVVPRQRLLSVADGHRVNGLGAKAVIEPQSASMGNRRQCVETDVLQNASQGHSVGDEHGSR